MSRDLTRCALIPGKLAGKLAVKINRDNSLLDSEESLMDMISTVIVTSEPQLQDRLKEEDGPEMYKTYIDNVALLLRGIVDDYNLRYGNDTKPDLTVPLSSRELSVKINKSVLSKIESNSIAAKTTVTTSIVANTSNESTGEPKTNIDTGIEFTFDEYVVNAIARRSKVLEKGELSVHQLYKTYFSDYPSLAGRFRTKFINQFNSILVDTSSTGMGYNSDMNKVLEKTRLAFQDEVKEGNPEDYSSEDILQDAIASELYLASILDKEWDSVVKIYLTGVKGTKIEATVDEDAETVEEGETSYELSTDNEARKTYKDYDGSFSGFDQVTDVMKMHIYTTPRLIYVDGKWIQDPENPTLNEFEVKGIVDIVNKYPANIEGFKNAMEEDLAGMKETDPAKSILKSFHDKFFADSRNDGESKSFYYFLDSGRVEESDPNFMLQNILTALIVDMRSKQNMEHVIVNNGRTIVTRTQNRNVEKDLVNNFMSNISQSKDKTNINSITAGKIQVLEDGNVRITTKGKSGVIIKLEKGNADAGILVTTPTSELNDVVIAGRVLSSIGFPGYLDHRFLNHYKTENADDSKTSLANMVANMVYMVAVNDTTKREELGALVSNLKETTEVNTLPYGILDNAHLFFDPVMASAVEVEGVGANKMRKNGDGNVVATTGVRARLYDTPSLIDRLSDEDESVHFDNIFVNGLDGTGANYKLDGFYAKDGINVRGTRRSNSSMTLLEQHKYLIEDTFLKVAASNKYNSTLLQPAVMSDRSVIDLAMVTAKTGSFMPVTADGTLDEATLLKELVQARLNHQKGLEKVIIAEWSKYIKGLVDSKVIKTMPDISTIKKLNNFIIKSEFKSSDISKTTLVSKLMYTDYKKDGEKLVKIKDAFMAMSDILSDDVKAKSFFRRQMASFVNDLTTEGFTYQSLSFEAKEMLRDRFHGAKGKKGFESLVKAYFYHNNTIGSSIMDLNQGSLYQFKGDIDYKTANENPSWDAIQDTLRNQGYDGAVIDKMINEAKVNLALDSAFNFMLIDQTKRNAGLGSGFQHPRLADPDEPGKFLDLYSNTAVIDDPEDMVSILGDVSNFIGQEAYDASMFGHPLYFLKLNNSLGNSMSSFMNHGGAIKDISNEVDPLTGIVRFQKKATFNVFSNEILRNGSPALERLFNKMNQSMKFPAGTVGPNGEPVQNMHELWEQFGGKDNDGTLNEAGQSNNDDSWNQVLSFLSSRPEIRNTYIQKVGFTSGEKSGSRSINTKNVWEGNEPLKSTKFDNRYHGVILNSHHEFDTNAGDSQGKHDSEVSLITQIISAAAFEGNTTKISQAINSSIQSLTDSNIDLINEEITSGATDILLNLIRDTKDFSHETMNKDLGIAKSLVFKPALSEEEITVLTGLLNKYGAIKQSKYNFAKNLTIKALETREAFSDSLDILNSDTDTLDSAQIQSSMHSAIYSSINSRTVKLKFKGGQYVVSAVHDFMKLYSLPGGVSVTREAYMSSDLVKDELLDEKYFKNLLQTDFVTIDGKPVQVKDVKLKDVKANKVYGKKIGDGRKLEWVQYKSEKGIKTRKGDKLVYSIKDTDQFKDLIENAAAIKNGTGNISELEDERKKLKIALRKVLEDKEYGWSGQHAEFYMPMIHQSRYNLSNGDSVAAILGTFDESTVEGAREGRLHRIDVFTDKIMENYTKYKLDRFSPITEEDVPLEVERLTKRVGRLVPGSIEYITTKSMLDTITRQGDVIDAAAIKNINDNKNDQRELYVKKLAEDQADNFPKTLEFLTARIPAQGKQSYMAGKIKGFINSNQNAIYGPAEMLTVTGADHDIDKANIMAYSVDENGIIYDYKPYEVDGEMSKSKFNEILDKKKKLYLASAKSLEIEPKVIKRVLRNITASETKNYIEATKNFLLKNLIDSALDPVNAVEAATPMSMDDLKSNVDNTIQMVVKNGRIINKDSSFVTPYNPASKPSLEMINSVGKQMIGIYASGIKAYSAVFTSIMSDPTNSKLNKFAGDLKLAYNGSQVFQDVLTKLYGSGTFNDIDNSIFIVNEGEKPVSSNLVANTARFTSKRQESEVKLAAALEAFKADYISKKGDNYNHAAMIEAFDKETVDNADRLLLDDTLGETQAWEQISELLSAATDNAKELILGKIGANNMTGGMMTAGLVLGFDLKTILKLFSNPTVKEFFKKVEKSRDTTLNEGYMDIKTELENHLNDILLIEKGTSKLSVVLQNIQADLDDEKAKISEVKIPNYDEAKEEMGVDNISEILVKGPLGNVVGIENFVGVNQDSETNTPLSNELKEEVKTFLASRSLNPKDFKLTRLGAIFKNVNSSDKIIIGDKLDNGDEDYVLRQYAASKGIPVYSMDVEGSWIKTDGGVETKTIEPLLSDNTGYFSGSKISTGQLNQLSKVVESTKEFLANPESYSARVERMEGRLVSKIETLTKERDNMVNDFVTDPLRQLRTLNSVAEELKTINSLILNQGLPNNDWDIHRFFSRIVDNIPAIGSISSFKDFISSVESRNTGKPVLPGMLNDGGKFAKDLLRTVESGKTAFNPLYVLMNNKHYFGYVKSVILAQDLVQSSSFINEGTEYIIDNFINPNNNNFIKDNLGYNSVKSFVHGLSIESYLSSTHAVAKIGSREFKLDSQEDRPAFMEEAVNLIATLQEDESLSDNPFVSKLRKDTIKDMVYYNDTDIIKINNMFNLEPHDISVLKLGLSKLKKSHPEAYNSLFYYSLILNRGGRGQTSFSSLFDIEVDAYKGYLKSLKGTDMVKFKRLLSGINSDSVLLGNYDTIKLRSTSNKRISIKEDGTISDRMYNIPNYNPDINSRVFRSRDNNKVYVGHPVLGKYVVVTPKYNQKFIPFSTKGNIGDLLGMAGYQWGETAKYNEAGDTLQVLAYSRKHGYIVEFSNGTTGNMTGAELQMYNSDMVFRENRFGRITSDEKSNLTFNPTKGAETVEKYEAKYRTYYGKISRLGPNQVFVFGSNLEGLHGRGAAGAAFGAQQSVEEIKAVEDGTKGKWAVKGVGEGMMVGLEGKSYAFPTVVYPGRQRSRTDEEIKESVLKLYNTAKDNPGFEYMVAYSTEPGLAGYSPEELASFFASHDIPSNIVFERGFNELVRSVGDTNVLSTESKEDLDIATLLTNGLVSTNGLTRVDVKGAEVFTKQVFTEEESGKVFSFIEGLYDSQYDTEHKSSDKFGKGRRSMYFSDSEYKYSGTTRPANNGTPEMQRLVDKITTGLGFESGYFDMVLVNEYKDGSQKIGFHTDNEPILNNKGKLNPSVVTISFGDNRTMILKGNGKEYKIPMVSGMGLVMGKDGQVNYKHGIDAEDNKSKRFSITLRHNADKSQGVDKQLNNDRSNDVTEVLDLPVEELTKWLIDRGVISIPTDLNVERADLGGLSPAEMTDAIEKINSGKTRYGKSLYANIARLYEAVEELKTRDDFPMMRGTGGNTERGFSPRLVDVITQAINSGYTKPTVDTIEEIPTTLKKREELSSVPKDLKFKSAEKASVSNKFIGYTDPNIPGMTSKLARGAGDLTNTGEYSDTDVVFVSIAGNRGLSKEGPFSKNPSDSDKKWLYNLNQTTEEVFLALDSGATIITDPISYTNKNSYNVGEKALAEELTKLHDEGKIDYKEEVVDGETIGVWRPNEVGSIVPFHKGPITYTDTVGKMYASRKVNKDVLNAIFSRLNDMIGGKAKLMTAATISTMYGKKYAGMSGFVLDGQVVINSDVATMDTPMHEIGGHIYLRNLKNTDPEAYAKLTAKAAEHPMAEYIRSKYSELKSTEDIGEEVFSTLLGLESQGKLADSDAEFFTRVKDQAGKSNSIIDFLVRMLQKIFGVNTRFKININDSLLDIIASLNNNIIFGDGSALKNLNSDARTILDQAINPVKSESDIEQKLRDLGLITKICR